MRISDWSSDVCSSDLIGMQPFGMRARDVEADHRAPGMAHDEELPLSIMLEKVGNEFLPIRGHPVDGNRRRNGGGVVRSGGLAGAPLVPLDDGEIILPRALIQPVDRSEEHTSELQSLMRISYAVFS